MKKRTQYKGFTLIELLVVIAVISLLVSILLPSLKRAKDLAGDVVCKSNLKQYHMAFLYYAEDNNDYFTIGVNYDCRKFYLPYLGGGYNAATTCPLTESDQIQRNSKSYAINSHLRQAETVSNLMSLSPCPQEHLLFADAVYIYRLDGSGRFTSPITNSIDIGFRHPQSNMLVANMLFIDGSVGSGNLEWGDWMLGSYSW